MVPRCRPVYIHMIAIMIAQCSTPDSRYQMLPPVTIILTPASTRYHMLVILASTPYCPLTCYRRLSLVPTYHYHPLPPVITSRFRLLCVFCVSAQVIWRRVVWCLMWRRSRVMWLAHRLGPVLTSPLSAVCVCVSAQVIWREGVWCLMWRRSRSCGWPTGSVPSSRLGTSPKTCSACWPSATPTRRLLRWVIQC